TKFQVAYGTFTCTFSPDGKRFAAADHGSVRFWEVGSWKPLPALAAFGNFGLAYSPDGRTLATASVEGVRLYELATGQERLHLRPSGYPSGMMRFSPCGRWLAWNADRTAVHVWDVRRGELLGPFTGHDADVTDLAFTADGRLVSSSDDSTLLVWDVAG